MPWTSQPAVSCVRHSWGPTHRMQHWGAGGLNFSCGPGTGRAKVNPGGADPVWRGQGLPPPPWGRGGPAWVALLSLGPAPTACFCALGLALWTGKRMPQWAHQHSRSFSRGLRAWSGQELAGSHALTSRQLPGWWAGPAQLSFARTVEWGHLGEAGPSWGRPRCCPPTAVVFLLGKGQLQGTAHSHRVGLPSTGQLCTPSPGENRKPPGTWHVGLLAREQLGKHSW